MNPVILYSTNRTTRINAQNKCQKESRHFLCHFDTIFMANNGIFAKWRMKF